MGPCPALGQIQILAILSSNLIMHFSSAPSFASHGERSSTKSLQIWSSPYKVESGKVVPLASELKRYALLGVSVPFMVQSQDAIRNIDVVFRNITLLHQSVMEITIYKRL